MRIYKQYKDHKLDHDGTCEYCKNIWPCEATIAFNDGLIDINNLITVKEIRELLDISYSRAQRLTKTAKFPKAVFTYSRGRLYRRDEIEDFMENGWNRKPGRPKSEKSDKGMWFEDVEEF